MKSFLITGCYGFLGYSTSVKLLERGHSVIGLDRVQDARSPKGPRVQNLAKYPSFKFLEADLSNWEQVHSIFKLADIDEVMHFAAQYSVPASTQAAQQYAKSNCHGFINMMAAAHEKKLKRFHYASSTFVEEGFRPTSMYGATKQFNEDWANIYSHQYGMTTVGIRYGSTFGPWCRPDIGIYTQTRRMLRGEPVPVREAFSYQTAFLWSADAVEATVRLMDAPLAGHNLFTVVAEDHRRDMGEIVRLLEKHLGMQAKCDWVGYKEKGPGGIPQAQCDKLRAALNWAPPTKIDEAVGKFANWARGRHAEGKF